MLNLGLCNIAQQDIHARINMGVRKARDLRAFARENHALLVGHVRK